VVCKIVLRVYNKKGEDLNAQEWDEIAYNFAQGLRNITAILSPEIIVIGGGVAVGGGNSFITKVKGYLADSLKLVKVPEIILSKQGYNSALKSSVMYAKVCFEG